MEQIGALVPGIVGKVQVTESGYTPDFEAFWKVYPKKVGKQKSFKEWKKVKKRPQIEPLLVILQKQIAYKAKRKQAGEFEPALPDPERWIKYARWEDEIPENGSRPLASKPIMVLCKHCRKPFKVTEDHRCQSSNPQEGR